MAQLKNPPAPVSKTVQRLLAQIHAEAQAATLAALSAKDGIVTLQCIDRESGHIYAYPDGDFDWIDGKGYRLEFRRQRFMPESWRDAWWMKDRWRPGQWRLNETRLDGYGNKWERDLGDFITDDFGTLVCVRTGAEK